MPELAELEPALAEPITLRNFGAPVYSPEMRALVLGTVLLVGGIALGGAQAQTPKKLNAYQVSGNVYLLNAGTLEKPEDGSIAVLVGNDGVLLVNAGSDEELVRAALTTITDKPVRYVIHTGCDTAGNAAFARDGATIVARDRLRKRLEAKKCDDRGVLPTLTFKDELTLHFAKEEVRIIALPIGHTDNDALVYFTKANVAVTGDVFSLQTLPAYSKYAGGNALGVNEQLHRYLALLPEDVKIIPGHGTRATLSDVRQASQALDQLRDAVAEEVRSGKTLEQIRALNLMEPWKALRGPNSPPHDKMYYDCLTGLPDPKFQL